MHRLVPVTLALLFVLAGCNALAPQQSSNNSSEPSTTVTDSGETVTPTEPSTPSATATPTTTSVSTVISTPATIATPATTAAPTASENRPSAATVKTRAMTAIDAVDTYRVTVNRTVRLSGNLDQTVVRVTTGTFDRDTHKARVTMTQSVLGRTLTSERYLVNGTLYMRSRDTCGSMALRGS